MEDHLEPLPGVAKGTGCPRSATALLLVDDGHLRSCAGGLCRKRLVEIQYLRTTISDQKRQEFGRLGRGYNARRIESADFLPHSGIRFLQNPCSTCPYVGLCHGQQELATANLMRRPGAEDFGWIGELNY